MIISFCSTTSNSVGVRATLVDVREKCRVTARATNVPGFASRRDGYESLSQLPICGRIQARAHQ